MSQWRRKLHQLMHRFERWVPEVDRLIGQMVEMRREGRPVSCSTCTEPGCCYQPTVIPFGEAMYIAWRLLRNGGVPAVTIDEWERVGFEVEGADRAEWFASGRPCIFLKDKLCSIYEFRPEACRRYFVVSPAADCLPPGKIVDTINGTEVDFLWLTEMARLEELIGLPRLPRLISLQRGVAIALRAWALPTRNEMLAFIGRQRWLERRWGKGMSPVDHVYNIRR